MDQHSSSTLFECASCGNLGYGDGTVVCCDREMVPVGEDFGVDPPTLETLMRTVFDMSGTELDVCLCVMEGGEQTVQDLADRIDYDRSVVSRHLNHLVDLGVVDKRRRLLEEGGQVYVFTPTDSAAVRRRLTGAFLDWAGDALSIVDSLSREKIEAMAAAETTDPQWRIYQE